MYDSVATLKAYGTPTYDGYGNEFIPEITTTVLLFGILTIEVKGSRLRQPHITKPGVKKVLTRKSGLSVFSKRTLIKMVIPIHTPTTRRK